MTSDASDLVLVRREWCGRLITVVAQRTPALVFPTGFAALAQAIVQTRVALDTPSNCSAVDFLVSDASQWSLGLDNSGHQLQCSVTKKQLQLRGGGCKHSSTLKTSDQPAPPLVNPYDHAQDDSDDGSPSDITVHGVESPGNVGGHASDVDVCSVGTQDTQSTRSSHHSRSSRHSRFSRSSRKSRSSHRSRSSFLSASRTSENSATGTGRHQQQQQPQVTTSATGGLTEKALQRIVIERDRVLGCGGYGVVYGAHDPKTRRLYAVKEATFNEGSVSMVEALRSEFRLLASFSHPHIIRVHSLVVERSVARIYMELAPNGSVRSVLKQLGGRMSERGAGKVVYQSLLGLLYLHSRGILHRDIKIENMLMDSCGLVKLSDFGTCKNTIHAASGTTTHVVGTVCYMSPESIGGVFSMGSDIWALACSFVELVTGKPPWSECAFEQNVQLLFHIGSARPPEHHPLFPKTISQPALAFLEACFAFDARQRPTALQLLQFPFFADIGRDLANQTGLPVASSPAQQQQQQRSASAAKSSPHSPTKGSQQQQQQRTPENTRPQPPSVANPLRAVSEFRRSDEFGERSSDRRGGGGGRMRLMSTPTVTVPQASQLDNSLSMRKSESNESFISWHSVRSPSDRLVQKRRR